MIVREISCKSILNRSGIPGIDYAINPYVGCGHKCQYCYAVFMKRFTGHTEPWGDFVDVKINAPEVLERQLRKLKNLSCISFGTVCDPYQQIEVKYMITRKCLEKLTYHRHKISILTKSYLVLRDLDILKKIKDIEVGFSITTLNTGVTRIFEPNTAPPQKRLKAIKILNQNKIPSWIFNAPVLPYFSDTEEAMSQLFRASQNAGVNCIMFDTLNPYSRVWNNVLRLIKKHFPEALDFYDYYYNNKSKYEEKLREKISKISHGYKINYRLAF